eukprot:gene9687-11888_t
MSSDQNSNDAPKPTVGKLQNRFMQFQQPQSGDAPKPNFKIPAKNPAGRSLPTTPGTTNTTTPTPSQPNTTSTPTPSPQSVNQTGDKPNIEENKVVNPQSPDTTTNTTTTTPTPSQPIAKPISKSNFKTPTGSFLKPSPFQSKPSTSTSDSNPQPTTPSLKSSPVLKPSPIQSKPSPSLSPNTTTTTATQPSESSNNTTTPPTTSPTLKPVTTSTTDIDSTPTQNIPDSTPKPSPVIKPTFAKVPTSQPTKPLLKPIGRPLPTSTPTPTTTTTTPNTTTSKTNVTIETTTPPLSPTKINNEKPVIVNNNNTITTPPPQSPITKPIIIKNESSEISKKSTDTIRSNKKEIDRVRVLYSRKGDFNSLNIQRGDILTVVERGEKDQSIGSNGYKTASFSMTNIKEMYPVSSNPPDGTQMAIAIKDIKTNKNFTIIRGDLLCILDKKTDQISRGRVKVGLDGWGEIGEFPIDSIRLIDAQDYQLYSDLLDLIIEVSERLMDPDSFQTNTGVKESDKEIEKKQVVLRDKIKNIQIIREKILNNSEDSSTESKVQLRKEMESTRALLYNEFYIINPSNGSIQTEETLSPITLLKEHYSLIGEKKSFKSDKLGNKESQSEVQSSSTRKTWEYGQLMVELKLSKSNLPKKSLEFYFSLYNFSQSKYLTEQLQYIIDPQSNSNQTSFKFMFKNIEPFDLTEDICLVCKVIRKGSFKDTEDPSQLKKGLSTDFRRPYSYACFKFSTAVVESQIGLERETNLQFFTSSDLSFSSVPDYLMKNNEEEIKKHIEPIPKVGQQYFLAIGISFYDMTFDKCQEKYPTISSLSKVEKLEHKVVLPEKKHHFYLTIENGKFTQGKKLELTLRVRLENGEFLNNCMSLGSGSPFISEIKTLVCYNTTSPIWNEFIHFSISQNNFRNAHLLFTIKNASSSIKSSNKDKNSVFAFGFLKLGNQDSTVILNGDHNLVLYKTNTDQIPVTSYISTTAATDEKSSKGGLTIRKNESIKVKSLFHSSQFIQHQSIIQLLNWKEHQDDLPNLLDRFKFVDSIQIMRNLTKILDALFNVYDESSVASSNLGVSPVALLVYNTIVFIIGLLTDERTNRFKYFKQELDTYINDQFSASISHKHILTCISFHLQDISHKESAKISSTLKALDYMFQLIVKSRLVYLKQQQNSTSLKNDQEDWKRDLREFLGMLNRLMSNNSPQLIVIQTLALRNFAVVMKGLSNFFTKIELCSILCKFIESVHYSEKQEHLNSYKISIYYQILSTQLQLDQETLDHLLPTLISTINQHLTRGEELKLSTQLLALLLESLETIKQEDQKHKHFNKIMTTFSKLTTLVDNLLSLSTDVTNPKDTPITQLNYDSTFLVSCFLTMLHYLIQLKESNGNSMLEKYTMEQQQDSHIKLFLRKIFRILEGFLSRGIYSQRWPTMQLFQIRVTYRVIDALSPFFYKYSAINSPVLNRSDSGGGLNRSDSGSGSALLALNRSSGGNNLEMDGWNIFFNLHFSFLLTNVLKLNENRIHRLYYIRDSLTSVRVSVLNSIRNAWNQLNQSQSLFYQPMIGSILYCLLNCNDDVNELVQDFFYTIMKKEYAETKSFKKVESKTIEILDKIIIRERIADEEIFKHFLSQRLGNSLDSDAGLQKDGKLFMNNILQLLSLLFDFRTLPTDRSFEEERTIATLKMMEYFKDRKDTYIKYLHELLNQHLSNNYFTEAGYTFLLHSELYQWGDQNVPLYSFTTHGSTQPTVFPQESSTDRKIRLIKYAIQYLDKGQVWEKCISLIQDLKQQFELSFNFKALSEIIFQEVEFYEKILGTERFFSEYFRVGYYGKKFPVTIQGKEFLYKGFELERLSDFTGRILSKFPDAELLKSTSEPTPEIQNSDGQYLLITIVNPSSIEEVEKRERKIIEGTPNNSRNYLKRNDVNVFVYSKPFEKSSGTSTNNNNKFGDLWIKNHFLFTDSSFPTIHRRAEVIKKTHVDLNPIENAINSVSGKNDELDEMMKKYDQNPQLNLNPLAMALNGSIDAAVNGGISLYKEAFFDKSHLIKEKDLISKLATLLRKQVDILEKGLIIHSIRCPEELRGLHEKLESFFPKLKAEVLSLSI